MAGPDQAAIAPPPRSALLEGYRLATSLAHPLAGPLLAWRARKGKEDAARRAERYGTASEPRPGGPLVWIHAASVGETMTVLPLIERIASAHQASILLTTGTVTSARLAAARLPSGALHQFVPLDGPRFVRRFLGHWQPQLALFCESELWPNMLVETTRRDIPLVLVNARMSRRSFEGWQRGPGMIRALLACCHLCLAQSEADASRLSALGAARVTTPGNMKFDAPAPTVARGELARFSAALGGRPRWAAVSTHPGEDGPVIEAHLRLAARHPGLLTIIVPRHPERGADIADYATRRGLKTALRSIASVPAVDTELFVADSIGELGLVYPLVPLAFVGGSLVPHGGHNPIEAAKLSTAILHGPHVGNFAEVYAGLDEAGGAEEVASAADLAGKLDHLLASPRAAGLRAAAAATAIGRFSGALERTMTALAPLLAAIAPPR